MASKKEAAAAAAQASTQASNSPNIKPCTCKHAYQDEKYGVGMRVHNPGKKPVEGGKPTYKCTVCGTKR